MSFWREFLSDLDDPIGSRIRLSVVRAERIIHEARRARIRNAEPHINRLAVLLAGKTTREVREELGSAARQVNTNHDAVAMMERMGELFARRDPNAKLTERDIRQVMHLVV